MNEYVVAIDLGGTKILTARLDLQGQVLAQAREQTRAEQGPDAVINRMLCLIVKRNKRLSSAAVMPVAATATAIL